MEPVCLPLVEHLEDGDAGQLEGSLVLQQQLLLALHSLRHHVVNCTISAENRVTEELDPYHQWILMQKGSGLRIR